MEGVGFRAQGFGFRVPESSRLLEKFGSGT